MENRHCAEISPILLAAALSAILDRRPAAGGFRLAGLTEITESMKELNDVFQGIHSFLSGVSFITETIGFGTIILFLAVIIFSAGYSALGLPRGKTSFFSSLITADLLWIFWKVSFNTPLSDYLHTMIKSNLLVLCPLILAALISRAAPGLPGKIRTAVTYLFRKKKTLGQREATALCEECQARGARFTGSLMDDILGAGGPGNPVSLSAETRKNAEDLRETLEKIDRTER